MRSAPYPIPPSKTWTLTALATYGALALAGAIILYVVASTGDPFGQLVLLLWGGLTLPAALACMWGVAASRYRFEWMGCWGITMGTAIYLAVTIVGVVQAAPGTMLSSAPTILVFVYALGRTLGRAIVLSLIDMAKRRELMARTGEIPEVPVDEY